MESGLLWYDGDTARPLEEKVGRAAQRYREKHGREPNTCYVHPGVVAEQAGERTHVTFHLVDPCRTIRVVPAPNILLHHYWLGETTKRALA